MGPKRRKRAKKALQIGRPQLAPKRPALDVSALSRENVQDNDDVNDYSPTCEDDQAEFFKSRKMNSLVESESEEEPQRPVVDGPAAHIYIDHGYSGAPPLFLRKSNNPCSVVDSVLDQRKRKIKDMQELLQTQTSKLVICPRECHGNCVDVHHPLLVALLNCRDIDDKKEMKTRLINLLNIVKKHASLVSMSFKVVVIPLSTKKYFQVVSVHLFVFLISFLCINSRNFRRNKRSWYSMKICELACRIELSFLFGQ